MIREVYIAFRTALATAVELEAALVCTHYKPGAERELAAQQAREEAWRATPYTEPTPAQRAAWDKWWQEVQEFKRDESTISPWDWAATHHRLYMVPEPYISQIMAMAETSRALYEADYDNWDKCLEIREKAETIGFEEWERWLKLESRGQTTTWEYLEVTLGEFRPGCVLGDDAIALDPAQVRALFAALCDWQASVGGRDAAVAYLAEKSHGQHLGLTRHTYDVVFALYQYGASHGCGLIDSPLYDMI